MSINKRDTGSLELSTHLFQHQAQNPVAVNFSHEQLSRKRSKLSICHIHKRLRWRICHNPLGKKHSCWGPYLVQFTYRGIKWIPVLPFLFPYEAGRMPVKMIFADMV